MGLFSTKKKRKHFTAVQRLLSDDDVVLSSKVGMLRYLLDKSRPSSPSVFSKSIPDYLLESAKQSYPSSFNRAYNYAASGSYAYGLPTADSVTKAAIDLDTKVKNYLDTAIGYPVTLLYATLGDANYQHFLWHKLINQYGYNPVTNELTTLSTSTGFPCYLLTGQLYYGNSTVVSDETGTSLLQHGVSIESGACISRTQDLGAAIVPYAVDLGVEDAYCDIEYQYIEVIPDITPPPDAIVNNLSTTAIDGYAEKNSSIEVYVNTVLDTTITADSLGYFTYTFGTALIATDTVKLVVIDAASNTSTGGDTVVPYTNGSPATVGTDPTITEVLHTESFSFDFLDLISSTVPVPVVAYGETPAPSVGSDLYVPEPDWIQASYTYNNGVKDCVGFLTYAHDAGTIPELDDLFNGVAAFGQFYPRVYFKLNSVDLVNVVDKTTPEYKTSKQIANKIGMNWATTSKILQDGVENASDDFNLGDVTDMFITLAAPMNTTDATINEYLYQYWLKAYTNVGSIITTGDYAGAKSGTMLRVKDNVYTHYVSYDAISTHVLSGTPQPVGSYTSQYLSQDAIAALLSIQTDPEAVDYDYAAIQALHPYHAYRYQHSSTEYTEIRVYAAVSGQAFAGGGTHSVGAEEDLIVPLDRSAVLYMTSKEKEMLYSKCLYLLVNISIIIKINWYQRGIFQVVLIIVAVAIAVFSSGTGTPISTTIITTVIKVIALSILMEGLLNLAVTLGLDPNIVGIFAVIALIYSGYIYVNGSEVFGLTAVELLQVSTVAFQLNAKINMKNLEELYGQMGIFKAESKEKMEQIRQAKELLGTPPVDLSLDLLLSDNRSKVFITLGETPDEYMSRTSMNIIEVAQSYVSDYVSIMMQPPNLQQMLNQVKKGDANGFYV